MLFDLQLDREISDRQIDWRVTIYAVWSTVRQRDIRQINRQKNQVTHRKAMKQRNMQRMNVKFCKVWHQFLNVKQIVASSWKKYCQMRAMLRCVMYQYILSQCTCMFYQSWNYGWWILAGGSIAKSSISSIFLLQLWPVPTNIKEWELVIGILRR